MVLDEKQIARLHLPPPPFENAEWELRITYSVETDRRIMSFVDTLYGFEVTGGFDQGEALTVIDVKRGSYARRAGIRPGDIITRINDTPALDLTLREAQLLIRNSGKNVKVYVMGDDYESDDEFTVDFWFTPPIKKEEWPNKWSGDFPWNDRKKRVYKESNCFLVPSIIEERMKLLQKVSEDNKVDAKVPIIPTVSDENTVDAQRSREGSVQPETASKVAETAAAPTQNGTTLKVPNTN